MRTLIDMLGMDYDGILEWKKKEEGGPFDPMYEEIRKAAENDGMNATKGASVNMKEAAKHRREIRIAEKTLENDGGGDEFESPREFSFVSRGGFNRKIKAASQLLHKGEADVVKFLLGTGPDNIVSLTSKTSEKDAEKLIEQVKMDKKDRNKGL
jgi:hypothetical protein